MPWTTSPECEHEKRNLAVDLTSGVSQPAWFSSVVGWHWCDLVALRSMDTTDILIAVALMLYEYLLTMADEKELIWRQRFNPLSWIFSANRVFLLFWAVDMTTQNTTMTVR